MKPHFFLRLTCVYRRFVSLVQFSNVLHVFRTVEPIHEMHIFLYFLIIIFYLFCATLKKLREYQNTYNIYKNINIQQKHNKNILCSIRFFTNELCLPVSFLMVGVQTLKDDMFKIKHGKHINVTRLL